MPWSKNEQKQRELLKYIHNCKGMCFDNLKIHA